jgi:rubrerythrin
MELDGKKYYEELYEKTSNKGLKKIFEMLAQDELKHYNTIKNFKKNKEIYVKSQSLRNSNNMFTEMLSSSDDFPVDNSNIEAYNHACGLEDESIKTYQKYKEEASSEEEKIVFDKLILEEKNHKLILENVIEFVTAPDRNRGVKTVDSDPEFARWDETKI